ncbi:MAG: hypothetical protein ACREKL_01300 [Chthoniobacterales bacterium]
MVDMTCSRRRVAVLVVSVGLAMMASLRAQQATFLSSFGSHGTGNGQLSFPSDICVDPATGKVYVADYTDRPRIQRFSATGVFELAWNTDRQPTPTASISLTWSKANSKAASRLTVGNIFSKMITIYAPDGSSPRNEDLFVKGVGALACRQSTGDLYVAEVFPSGNSVRVDFPRWNLFGANLQGRVSGLAVNEKTGEFYLSTIDGEVQRIGLDGFRKEWENNYPRRRYRPRDEYHGIAVDAAGNVYVSGDGRVLRFSSNGSFQFNIGEDRFFAARRLAITPDGILYVIEDLSRVSRWKIDEKNEAPVLKITSSRTVTTARSNLLIRGSAKDDGDAVEKVTVRIGRARYIATGTDKWRIRIPLTPGRHTIRIVATDFRGEKSAPKSIVAIRG